MKNHSYIKRIITSLICVLFFALLCACKASCVNDTETGDITLSEQKVNFPDGKYSVYESYLNKDGYSGVLSAYVKGGKIVGVNFDFVTDRGVRYSQTENDENHDMIEQFKSEVKSLNNKILQSQSLSSISNISITKTNSSYYRLASGLFSIAFAQSSYKLPIDTTEIYTEYTEYKENGYRSVLSVSFYGANIVSVDFSQRNQDNINITSNREFIDAFNTAAEEENMTYSALIVLFNTFGEGNTLNKSGLPECAGYLKDDYNSLAEKIIRSHRAFDSAVWLL